MVRVVVVGAGIVGAACAYELTTAGADVTVLDTGPVGSGTTSRGEGNILVSDKAPGPELDLALASRRIWGEFADELGADALEFEAKGGLVVASTCDGVAALQQFAEGQRRVGVAIEPTGSPQEFEPHLAADLPGGVFYPDDAQVQPVLAAATLLQAAIKEGAVFSTGEFGSAVTDPHGRLSGVQTTARELIAADAVVNAAGTWGGEVAARLGTPITVLPRRGFVLVTEPLPPMVRHKVYSADYVANVASSDAGLETSCVVEGTRSGTILIGASRERVGFDPTMNPQIIARLAAHACALFPFLRDVHLIRTYRGFRPYCPDHLPVIGPDARTPGVLHACGHEGAGVGLAAGTAAVITGHLMGTTRRGLDPTRFTELLPDRMAQVR